METDDLELDTLGDRKTALFVIISDTDDTFNFIVAMMYTQLFNLLCDKADDVYGGRLPVHVRCIWLPDVLTLGWKLLSVSGISLRLHSWCWKDVYKRQYL